VQMRYSIPLFTYDGAVAATPVLKARIVVTDGRRYAEIRNVGQRHARLLNLRIQNGAREFTVNAGLVGYVLGGSTMRWALPAGAPIGGTIVVNANGADTSLAPTT
jgi:fimbrial chaperone protein